VTEENSSDKESINEQFSGLFSAKKDDRFLSPLEARKKAMDYLARREYGNKELKKKLAAFGFFAEAIEPAVAELVADGLQDDRRFVEAFVQSRVSQGKGPARILGDLSQRGIHASLAEEVIAATGEDWRALAREVRTKKFGNSLPADFKEKARQMRFLQYRGFQSDQITAAVARDDE
jgi:regulatory protein